MKNQDYTKKNTKLRWSGGAKIREGIGLGPENTVEVCVVWVCVWGAGGEGSYRVFIIN